MDPAIERWAHMVSPANMYNSMTRAHDCLEGKRLPDIQVHAPMTRVVITLGASSPSASTLFAQSTT